MTKICDKETQDMSNKSLPEKLGESVDNASQIAEVVTKNTGLLSSVLDGVSSPNSRVKFKCVKILRMISEKNPRILYPHFDFIEKLLDSDNNILKWNAIDVIANLATVDSNDRFNEVFNKFYGFLNEGTLITVAHIVDNSGKIAKAKPSLHDRITTELLKVKDIPLPTEECRNIVSGKTILAFARYFDRAKNKEAIISFVRSQLNSTRNATKKKAEAFLRKFDTTTLG
jgi:hypothetical protein